MGAVALVAGGFAIGQLFAHQPGTRPRPPGHNTGETYASPTMGNATAETTLAQRELWRTKKELRRLKTALSAATAERDEYREEAVEAQTALDVFRGQLPAQRAA